MDDYNEGVANLDRSAFSAQKHAHDVATAMQLVQMAAGVHPLRPIEELIADLRKAYAAVAALGAEPAPAAENELVELVPAVSVRKSVRAEAVTCIECGVELKSLKRHLSSAHGLTPEAYRERWGLKADHPIVAPEYAARRSELARASGLGRKS